MDLQTGRTAETPVYVRWVTDDEGGIRWNRIVLALALTVASTYLAAKAQRWGTSTEIPAKARFYHAVQVMAHKEAVAWKRLEDFAKTGYEIATLR